AAIAATRAEWATCADTQRRPAAAVAACGRILAERRQPSRNRAMAHNNRCDAYSIQRRYRLALADCDRAVRLDPRNKFAFGNRGRVQFHLGKYDQAIADLTRALRRNPGHYHYRFQRGRAYLGARRYRLAIAEYDRLIKERPRQAAAFNNRGVAYRGLGRHADALADFEKAVSLKPDYGQGLVNLGYQIWLRDRSRPGGFERAVETISMGLRFKPKYAHGHYLRGKVRAQRYLSRRPRSAPRPPGRQDKTAPGDAAAVEDLHIALRLNPRNTDAYLLLARLARSRNDQPRAIVNLDMAVRLSPNHVGAYSLRADAYLALGIPARAIPDLSRVIDLASRSSRTGSIGVRIQAKAPGALVKSVIPGAPAANAGLRANDTIIMIDGKSVAGLSVRDMAARIKGLTGSSVRLRIERPRAPKPFDRVIARADTWAIYNPALATHYRKRGGARIATRNYAGAEKDLAEALRLHPDAVSASTTRRERGHALGRLGKPAAAVRSYYAAVAPYLVSAGPRYRNKHFETDTVRADVTARIAADPKDIRALWVRSVTRGGDVRGRLADYARIVELAPLTPGIFKVRGAAYAQTGVCGLALSDFDRAARRRPDDAAVYRLRGRCHWKLGSVEAAIADFRRAVALKPASMVNLRLLLATLRKTNRDAEALVALDAAKGRILDLFGTLHLWRASIHEKAGRFGKAIEALDLYVGVRPKFARAVARRGALHLKAKDYRAAIADYSKAIALGAKTPLLVEPSYYGQRGRAYYHLKEYGLAVRDLSTAIRRRGKPTDNGTISDTYVRALARHAAKQTAAALEDLAHVVAARPKFADAWNMRAWLLWESGRAAEGMPHVQKALALAPDNPAYLDTRAHIHEAMGRTKEAIADYRRALEIKPDLKESREGLRRLTKQTAK
ncbi:MAG: tetratricopeptide repeat protein, partial [Bauldia litoralis]